jgi:CRISPR-associated exonuclease Cas4
MEHTSDTVAVGRLISASTYKREDHEIQIDDIVLDFYDAGKKIIHEVKKSDKMEDIHIWQVKYYISVLEDKGITGVIGEIDYPKLRQKIKVELTGEDKRKLQEIKSAIAEIIKNEIPPKPINKPFCKNCSYYDLCYV